MPHCHRPYTAIVSARPSSPLSRATSHADAARALALVAAPVSTPAVPFIASPRSPLVDSPRSPPPSARSRAPRPCRGPAPSPPHALMAARGRRCPSPAAVLLWPSRRRHRCPLPPTRSGRPASPRPRPWSNSGTGTTPVRPHAR
nr:proline-rich protein 18-like [Aegilops tauschii subsp. strangulata]